MRIRVNVDTSQAMRQLQEFGRSAVRLEHGMPEMPDWAADALIAWSSRRYRMRNRPLGTLLVWLEEGWCWLWHGRSAKERRLLQVLTEHREESG